MLKVYCVYVIFPMGIPLGHIYILIRMDRKILTIEKHW